VSDYDLTALSGLGLIAILGFMVFNFPWGRIFLGDGGAYFIGFYVAWIAIMLPARNDVVSPLASLLICSYPIIETLFSIFRKTVRTGYHPGLPDRVHFHMLVYRRVASRLLPHGYPIKLKNSLTAVLIFPFGLLPVILVYFNYSDSNYLIFSFFIVFSIYIALYYGIIRFKFGWLHRHGRR
jgi:UDP-N-acetylmuramyl pentapeptide phosphotransferase/UDP-N-acetylglucosamine-1-phosphate transferase